MFNYSYVCLLHQLALIQPQVAPFVESRPISAKCLMKNIGLWQCLCLSCKPSSAVNRVHAKVLHEIGFPFLILCCLIRYDYVSTIIQFGLAVNCILSCWCKVLNLFRALWSVSLNTVNINYTNVHILYKINLKLS